MALTQAKRLDQVDFMARDALALLENVEAEEIDLVVAIETPDDIQEGISDLEELDGQIQKYLQDRQARQIAIAKELKGQGYPLRDIGQLLGMSATKANQLTKHTE